MKGSVTIYGSSYKMFSAEPYLVTLGDNVYISLDAKFICHDGSVLPFRKDVPDGTVVGGNPAKIIKKTSEYLEKAKKDSIHIGHLTGKEKVKRYKEIFGV